MEYRIGKCSQCGAEYKVPASFAHNVARCKLCKGVVHLGSSKGGAAPAEPARAAAKPAPPAERAPRPDPEATPPAPRPSARPTPSSEPRAPQARPAPEVGEPAPPEVAAAPRTPRAAPAPLAAAGRRPPVALYVLAGVGLLALAVFLFRDKLFGAPADERAPHSDAPPGEHETAPRTESGLVQPPAGAREAPRSTGVDGSPEALAEGDPRSIDLDALPELEPSGDTPTAEWKQLEEWVAQWLDEDAGAAGELAGKELATKGRKAVPAVLNFLKRQDFASADGRRAGELAQPFLKRAANGADFGWPTAHAGGPREVFACKLSLLEWTRAWQRCTQDVEAWIQLARLEEFDPREAKRLRDTFGVGQTQGASSLEQGN